MNEEQHETPLLLDVRVLAQMLGISVRTVWRLHDEGAIPRAVRIGRRSVRWDRNTIIKWAQDGCPCVRQGARNGPRS